MIKIGKVDIRDKYLINIYEAPNMTNITRNINKKYNPKEKIKNFSIDMISYYLWFSSFGYCEDKVISSGECCKKQILENWELIGHKNYRRFFEEDDPLFDLYEQIKNLSKIYKFFDDAILSYYYNFAILKSDEYKKFVFTFPGSTGVLQLLGEIINSGFTPYFESKNINVIKYFYKVFQRIYKDVFSETIINILKSYPDYQIIFTGHSLGGAVATLISYYYAKEQISTNEPVLITFGQPRVGNLNFAYDYMRLIKLVFRVARENDVVTQIPLAYKLNINIFDFIEKIIDGIFYKNEKYFVIIINIFENILARKLISKIPFISYGASHIGGLYFLKNEIFYHCKDFYNSKTGHPICRNIDFYLEDSLLKSHGYLNFGEEIISKCQKNRRLGI